MDKTFRAMAAPAQETPAFIEADHLTGKKESQIEAMGNAILRKRGQSIRADRLLYFQDTQDLDAQGSVVLEQDGNTMSGPHLKLNLDTSIGTMEQPVFYLADGSGRGAADMMHIQDKQHFTLDKAIYTTCPADNQDWLVKMSGLEIDRDQQVGTAHHAWVEFMGAPILYSPWMDFPLNKNRKSGFQSPVLGNSIINGRELTLPYYWNIAPNHDATIAPRVMTNRGVLLYNEFRYLEPAYSGEMHLDVLPNDKLTKQNRRRMSLQHNQHISGGLSGSVNLNSVSDNGYFQDLAGTTELTSQTSLLQEIVLNNNAGWWDASARIQRYQSLIPNSWTYKRLPQLTLNARQTYADTSIMFAGEFVDFAHPTLPNAKRFAINTSASYPLVNNPAFYLTPKVTLRSTYYTMGANNTGALPNASRTLPLYSVDSGVALERDWKLFGNDYLHTLEPRAFYVYVPYKNQDSLPNFDTGQAGFDFTQIFSEHRFVGNDRVGDANHITLALTSRLLEQKNGRERLNLMVGERFSFKTPQVNFGAPTTTNKSDILFAASGQITDTLLLGGGLQYDPNLSHTQNYNATAYYRSEVGKTINLGYRFTRSTLRQIDVSTQWPLFNRWHAMARLNYSIQDSKTLESIAGLEYNQSCWTFRLVAQRFVVAAQQANTGIFLQLELNDFVSVGDDPLLVLKKNVPSYTKLNEKPANPPSPVLR
ncbi:MAG TPA: LPS-assembly protein LptD [Gallionella sp.]|nr:LPS-assembly protein LptD [Gallionella sp.]